MLRGASWSALAILHYPQTTPALTQVSLRSDRQAYSGAGPLALNQMRLIAALRPWPPKIGAALQRLGSRQCYAWVASNDEKFAARRLYAIAHSLSGM